MGRDVRLAREKEIISTGNEAGGREEFIVTAFRSRNKGSWKGRGSTREAMKQWLLAMGDCWDNNDAAKESHNDNAGVLYGLITTGEQGRMIRYNSSTFEITNNFSVMFRTMGQDCRVGGLTG